MPDSRLVVLGVAAAHRSIVGIGIGFAGLSYGIGAKPATEGEVVVV